MNAIIRTILRAASRFDEAALIARRLELAGEIAALEILLDAADAKRGRARDKGRPLAAAPGAEDLADRIEARLKLHAPASDRALAEDLGQTGRELTARAISAVCKTNPDRFRRVACNGADNVWVLVDHTEED